jgi:hypothetical protein
VFEQSVNSHVVTIPPTLLTPLHWSSSFDCIWPWLVSLVEGCIKWRILCPIVQDDILVSGNSRDCASVQKTGFVKKPREIFGSKFPGKGLPTKRAIQALVKKRHATGSVSNAPKPRTPPPLPFARQKLLTTFPEGLCKVRRSQHVNYRSRLT